MPEPATLYLVDGSSYLYRAFHALPPLTTSDGISTGAITGVLNMLQKFLRDYDPQFIAIVMDAPGRTFRDDLFAAYKANRPSMPNELREQIEPLAAAIQAMGLPLLRISGVEADDVIGTLAMAAVNESLSTVISTGDKDMAQLVCDRITLLDTMPRGPDRSPRTMGIDGVMEKFGVRPDQIIDYLALVGDSSDNIPGVPQIGPKTAVALLTELGSVHNILANLEKVATLSVRGAAGIAERLQANQEMLRLSQQLATIKCDVALDSTPRQLQRQAADIAVLTEIYTRLELRNLLKSLPEGTGKSTTAAAIGTVTDMAAVTAVLPAAILPVVGKLAYEVILTTAQLDTWLQKIRGASLVALDTETTSLDYMQAEIVGLSFAVTAGEAAYLPVAHRYAGAPQQLDCNETLQALRLWLEDEHSAKVGHHLKYDAHVLANHGITLRGMRFDSMLESYVLDSTATRHDMDSVARKYLGVETIRYEEVAGKGARQLRFDEVNLEKAAPYAAEDADITLRLHQTIWPQIQSIPALEKLYLEIEQPLVSVLQQIEYHGVLIDRQMLADQSYEITEKLALLESQAHEAAGRPFNLSSPKQLQEILFTEQGLPVIRKTPTGQPSTAEDALQELADSYPLPRLILEYRGLAKLKSTYTDRLPEQINPATGRVHTSYHQAITATGRLSSSDPNLQNIPIRSEEGRRIRQAFIAPPGWKLIAADYSQIELRIMAHVSGDAGLLSAFAGDRDIHQATAAEVFDVALDKVTGEQRRSAKAINFGLIYGMSAFGLARQLGIGRDMAQRYVDLYFERYPGVRDYMERTREQARLQGYVETVFGRRLYLPDIKARQAQARQYAERSAINAPMQGTAADIIKKAMVDVQAWLQGSNQQARMIMQVHDELVLEAPANEAPEVAKTLAGLMSAAATLRVPLKVDTGIGNNWDEAH